MDILAGLGLLLAALSSAFAADSLVYFKEGGDLELRLAEVPDPLTSVLWKFGGNLLAEWDDSMADPTYYGAFKGRATLDTTSGALLIKGMTKDDRGVYYMEVNNKLLADGYNAKAIRELTAPKVVPLPLACGAHFTNCSLSCDGNVEEAGPIMYFWKLGEAEWKQGERELAIFNEEETKRVKTYSCRMKNQVSEKDSEPIEDPFSKVASPGGGLSEGAIAGIIIALIVIVIVGVGIFLWKYKDGEIINGLLTRLGLKKRDGDRAAVPAPSKEEVPLNEDKP